MNIFKKPYKILLILAIIFYCQYLFFQVVLTHSLNANFIYGADEINSWGIQFLSTLVFAPLIEELMYRGLFVKSRWRFLSYTLFVIGSCLSFYQIGYGYWSLFIGGIGLIFIYLQENNSLKFRFLLIGYSILIFAFSHYKPENLIQIETFSTIGNFIAGGCFLTWILLNYSLKASILVHASLNLVMFVIFIIGLNNVNSNMTEDCLSNTNSCYKLQEKPIFNSSISKVNRTTDSLKARDASISQILNILNIQDSSVKIRIYEPYKKFDLVLYKRSEEISKEEILQIMEKLKLIQIQNN
jgi:membrane protease YdiL (CAAX protease family)